jgi:hypothetical protein
MQISNVENWSKLPMFSPHGNSYTVSCARSSRVQIKFKNGLVQSLVNAGSNKIPKISLPTSHTDILTIDIRFLYACITVGLRILITRKSTTRISSRLSIVKN